MRYNEFTLSRVQFELFPSLKLKPGSSLHVQHTDLQVCTVYINGKCFGHFNIFHDYANAWLLEVTEYLYKYRKLPHIKCYDVYDRPCKVAQDSGSFESLYDYCRRMKIKFTENPLVYGQGGYETSDVRNRYPAELMKSGENLPFTELKATDWKRISLSRCELSGVKTYRGLVKAVRLKSPEDEKALWYTVSRHNNLYWRETGGAQKVRAQGIFIVPDSLRRLSQFMKQARKFKSRPARARGLKQ